jgi:hypothetical protein
LAGAEQGDVVEDKAKGADAGSSGQNQTFVFQLLSLNNSTFSISTYIRRGTSAWMPVDNIDESEFSMQLRSDESGIITT